MPKEKTWTHLWGQTHIPRKNLLVVIGIFIALSFFSIFLNDYEPLISLSSFAIIWVFVALFIIVARKDGVLH
jgi:hypothetical protein